MVAQGVAAQGVAALQEQHESAVEPVQYGRAWGVGASTVHVVPLTPSCSRSAGSAAAASCASAVSAASAGWMSTGEAVNDDTGTPGSESVVSLSRPCRCRHSGHSVGITLWRHAKHTRSHWSCVTGGSVSKMRSIVSGGSVSKRLASLPSGSVVPAGCGAVAAVYCPPPFRATIGSSGRRTSFEAVLWAARLFVAEVAALRRAS